MNHIRVQIIDKKIIAQTEDTKIVKISIKAPDIARSVAAGQFIILMVNEFSERIPLTVVNKDINNGQIELIYQEVGYSTKLLSNLETGDKIENVVGPLGCPTEIRLYGDVILVGGGVGIAEILPIAEEFKSAGNKLTMIIGARKKELLILESELKAYSDEFYITTDDGSYGRKGFVTDVIFDLLNSGRKYDLVYAVGPVLMMKKVSEITKIFNVKTIVSLNPIMVDGTGMCGSCRVTVDGKTKFACIDGPEFDAHQVDWDELEKRNKIYLTKERYIKNLYEKGAP